MGKERNIIALGDRFAKYSKEVFIRVNVNELKKADSRMARELMKLLEAKIKNFRWHIKFCEHWFDEDELTAKEKSFLARTALINKDKDFLFHLGWEN